MNDDDTKYRACDGKALTPAEISRLDEIEARLGGDDDIPEISDSAWASSVRGKHAVATQVPISIRLDADVVAWLRAKGPGYQTEIGRILRERMLQDK